MQSKLTLRLDDHLIAVAKERARRQGKSLSQVVADYFAQLDASAPGHERPMTPLVASLRGSWPADTPLQADDDRQAHRAHLDHLEAKHR